MDKINEKVNMNKEEEGEGTKLNAVENGNKAAATGIDRKKVARMKERRACVILGKVNLIQISPNIFTKLCYCTTSLIKLSEILCSVSIGNIRVFKFN